jgi:hypothetical protein
MKKTAHRLSIILLCLLHLFLGINGVAGGILLMIKTDGSMLGMQSDWLNHSPFNNYLIPGVLLFLFLGIIPLMTFLGLVKRRKWRFPDLFNIYRNRYWAWSFSLYTGIIAITWITIQLILTQYFWIQPVIIFNGLFIIIITMLPGIMKHFELNN